MKKILCLLFVLTCFGQLKAQIEKMPPPMSAMPSSKLVPLIDEVLTKGGFEDYFFAFCERTIKAQGKKKGWNHEDINKRIAKLDFKNFKKYTAYNAFSSYSEEELKDMLKLIAKVKLKDNELLITNNMIQNNLELFVLQFLE